LININIDSIQSKVVNNFDPRIRDKVHQLSKAKEFGLKIPEFVFTNQRKNVQDFLLNHDLCITKPISNFGYIHETNQTVSFKTNKIEQNQVEEMNDFFFPSFIQRGIDNLFELKCVYIGGSLFAVKQSTSSDKDYVDIKLAYKDNKVELENFQVNEDICKKVKNLCDFYKIDICTLDFLVDANDDYFFLEINQDGIIDFYARYFEINIYEIFCNFLLKK